MKLTTIHFLSGIIITLFTGLHLFNHLFSLYGADEHIQMMKQLRFVYRNIFSETILLAAVLVQIISGIMLFKSVRKVALRSFQKLHVYSGLYLAFFLVVHVTAILVGRFFLHLDTNFYFGVAGINSFPFCLFFIPYYTLAIISFFAHLSAIHHKKMSGNILYLTPAQQAKIILISGLIISVIIFYGLTNEFRGVRIPAAYKVLTGK